MSKDTNLFEDKFSLHFDQRQYGKESDTVQDDWTALVLSSCKLFIDDNSWVTSGIDYLAYNSNSNSMYVGSIPTTQGARYSDWIKDNLTFSTTLYSQTHARNVSTTADGWDVSERSVFIVWRVSCTTNQQQGLLNLTRRTTDQGWATVSAWWDLRVEVRPSMLSPLSGSLGKQEYKPMQSGLGPAFILSTEKCTTSDKLDLGCAEFGPKHLNYETLVTTCFTQRWRFSASRMRSVP